MGGMFMTDPYPYNQVTVDSNKLVKLKFLHTICLDNLDTPNVHMLNLDPFSHPQVKLKVGFKFNISIR